MDIIIPDESAGRIMSGEDEDGITDVWKPSGSENRTARGRKGRYFDMMESIWTATAKLPRRQSLQKDIASEAVVIGGGMAGILTAYFLEKRGVHTVVLEADRMGSGQTGGTTAKITLQHGLFYHRMTGLVGRERMAGYAAANREAVDNYRRIVEEERISCDFQRAGAFLYSRKDVRPLEEELAAAKQLGIEAIMTDKAELPFPVAGALEFPAQAMFHPLEFLEKIAEDLTVYEHTRAVSVEGNTVVTDRGRVKGKYIIFATHYPFINFPGYYFLRLHQERSYCIALKNAPHLDGMYYGIDPNGLSFRSAGDYLLLGGLGHRTGENRKGGQYQKLWKAAQAYYPGCTVEKRWSAQDCVTVDGIPYIGRYSAARPQWYAATGFHKWGMTGSMVSAMLISDLITEGKSPYEKIFTPQRYLWKASLPEQLKDIGHSAAGLGNIFSRAPRCPHLGCRLKWNRAERTWDCPCHGSRFTPDGELIDNPAQKGLG